MNNIWIYDYENYDLKFKIAQNGLIKTKYRGEKQEGSEVVYSQGLAILDAYVDNNDIIYILCKNKSQSFDMICYQNEKWHKFAILPESSKNLAFFVFNILYISYHQEDNIFLISPFDKKTFKLVCANPCYAINSINSCLCLCYQKKNGNIYLDYYVAGTFEKVLSIPIISTKSNCDIAMEIKDKTIFILLNFERYALMLTTPFLGKGNLRIFEIHNKVNKPHFIKENGILKLEYINGDTILTKMNVNPDMGVVEHMEKEKTEFLIEEVVIKNKEKKVQFGYI